MVDFYDDPAQMEPLLIDSSRPTSGRLIGLAHELSEASACLDAALAPATAQSLAALVENMRCRQLPISCGSPLCRKAAIAGRTSVQRNGNGRNAPLIAILSIAEQAIAT